MILGLATWRDRPVAVTFLASLLLSALAVGTGNLNRDGMLYTEAARAFLEGGLPAAKAVFTWPFLPVLMASLSALTGLSPDTCGHLLNALFLATACALMVDLIRRSDPDLAWLAAFVVLALPGLNEYRNELIREYGAWCFTMIALRLAVEWPNRPGWRPSLAIQGSLGVAMLFRPEAAVFFVCILLWQHGQTSSMSRTLRAVLLGGLPALLLLGILGAHVAGLIPDSSRIAGEISRFNFSSFDEKALEMGKAFNDYAREEAQTAHAILFFGSLALIPWKLIGKFGIFLLPLAAFAFVPLKKSILGRYSLLAWVFGGHLLVLAVFVLQHQFASGRYLGPLLLFSTPFVAFGLQRLIGQWPRWHLPILVLAGVIALANVTSLKPPKTHFPAAGAWLAAHHERESPRIFLESARTAHYAGWRYSTRTVPPNRPQLATDVAAGTYDLVVLEVSRKDKGFADWLMQSGLREIHRFSDANGDAIVVAEVIAAQRQVSSSAASKSVDTRASE